MKFVRGLFSDSTGPSWGRVGSFLWLLACLSWDSWQVFHGMGTPGHLATSLPDTSTLIGEATATASIYGVSKGIHALNTMKGAQNAPKP